MGLFAYSREIVDNDLPSLDYSELSIENQIEIHQSTIKKFFFKGVLRKDICLKKMHHYLYGTEVQKEISDTMYKGIYFEVGCKVNNDRLAPPRRKRPTKAQLKENPEYLGDVKIDYTRIDIQIQKFKELVKDFNMMSIKGDIDPNVCQISFSIPFEEAGFQCPECLGTNIEIKDTIEYGKVGRCENEECKNTTYLWVFAKVFIKGTLDILTPLRGIINRKFIDEPLVIVDLKLTQNLDNEYGEYCWRDPERMDHIQLTSYSYAFRYMIGKEIPTMYLIFDYKTKDKEFAGEHQWINYKSTISDYDTFLQSLRDTIAIIHNAHKNGWNPTPSYEACKNCSFNPFTKSALSISKPCELAENERPMKEVNY